MTRFYQPDLSENIDSPFVRDGSNKLVRRSYWLDMNDRTIVMVMINAIGAHLTNDEKRAHLTDLRREHLIDQVCIQEILPPEKWGLLFARAVLAPIRGIIGTNE
jgi:hypothetical protein